MIYVDISLDCDGDLQFIDLDVLTPLLEMIENDMDMDVKTKALYAISGKNDF
jgi:hypothetical protein